MRVLEQFIEARWREKVDIDDMHFGFRARKSTTGVILIVRQLHEKSI